MADMDMGLAPPDPDQRKKKIDLRSMLSDLLPRRSDSPNETARKIVFLLAFSVLIFALIMLMFRIVRYQNLLSSTTDSENGTNAYLIHLKDLHPDPQKLENLPEGTVNTGFAALYAENSDFIGWLDIPGTGIDYPVMQTFDNEFYLRRDFRKEYQYSGTLFADYEGVITKDGMPQNTIIYGHNLNHDILQFSPLVKYKDIEQLKLSPVINFDTLYGSGCYKIFSVFITNIKREHGDLFEYTKNIYFKNRDEFFKFVLECEDRSLYDTGIDIEYGDEFLTLSTCDRDTSMDLRLVIVARKVRETESSSVNIERFTPKTSVKYFKTYYSIFGEKWFGRTWDTSAVRGMDEYIRKYGLEDDPENYK